MKYLLGVLGFALFMMAASVSAADGGVTLRAAVEVDRASILLSDVFAGLPEGLDRAIATAPSPGKSVTYDVRVLGRLAEQYRLEWKPQSLADRTVLTRAATRITQDMIRKAVIEKLKEQGREGKIDITFDNRNLEVNLPSDKAPVFALNNFIYDPSGKRFRAEVMAEGNGGPVVTPVTGRVLVSNRAPVLVKRMEAGTVVSAADLGWIDVPEGRLTDDVIVGEEQIVGRELKRPLSDGQLIRTHDVAVPRLVTRGSLVTLKIETPFMSIATQGRALQDGAMGETVSVTNMQSKRVIEGVITAPGVVSVNVLRKIASVEGERVLP